MLVLHDEATRLHQTVELLGSQFKKALECPERIEEIFKALQNDGSHSIRTLDATGGAQGSGTDDLYLDPSVLAKLLSGTHDLGYLEHIRTTHEDWVTNGLIGEDECVFPECFYVPGMCKPGGDRPPPKDRFARAGYYAFDMSAGIAKDTWISARASANLAAVGGRVIASPDPSTAAPHRNVLALCRPPGHHCTTKLAGGYCYINNAVVAVESLRHHSQGLAAAGVDLKIAILDIDFHHGNGTQSYFYDDPSVLYVSIHGEDEYPYYSGFEDEVGEGRGHGYNVNLPLAVESSIDQYLEKLEIAIQKMQEFKPSHVLVSLGFDTFFLDPIGRFDLHSPDYETIARKVRQAEGLQDIPSLILLEGGYVVERLGENMLQFLKGWESK
ncbi:histone deacetylase superfamily [Thozetella sp. PMI_491]|nr:histone deacetylase superfamily [Thozetella sp. PMI_491]